MNTQLDFSPGSIVVAVDGSEHADRAVQWAAEQANLEHRPLAVVNAAGIGDLRGAGWVAMAGETPYVEPDLLRTSRGIVDAAADQAHRIAPEITVHRLPVLGDPRSVLIDLSADAHLLVMGSRGRGVVRSILLGSVSTAVTKHAECPVIVCRPSPDGVINRGVVVGADGTRESLPVVEFAFRMASLRHLRLTVLHCYWDVVAVVADMRQEPLDWQADEDLSLLLSESVAGLCEKYPDVQVDLRLAHGHVDEALVTMSAQWAMLVVGRHPVKSMSRLLTGSLATAVVERSDTTVAIVPEDEPSDER